MSMPADLQPFASLWTAALELLVTDALTAAHRGHKAGAESIAALDDILLIGPMTRRLCRPIGVDPTVVRDAVRARLDLPRAHRGHSVSSRSIA